jgi:hypothetical protein
MTASGESWLGNMPTLDFATPSAGELALSGVEVGATFASDGMLPLAGEIVGDLWGLNSLHQLLEDVTAAVPCGSAGNTVCTTTAPPGGLPTGFKTCGGGVIVFDAYIYGVNAAGVSVPIASMCTIPGQDNNGVTVTYCDASNGYQEVCPDGLGQLPTSPAITDVYLPGAFTPSNPYYGNVVRDLGQIISDYPQAYPQPSVQPGTVSDTYHGPSTITGTPFQQSVGGQTSTVTPSMSPTYSPQGVTPGPVTLKSCTGTGACTSTTVTPSNTTKTATPFVAPTGSLPKNPTLNPTATALTLNVTPVQGSCPPPVLLNLSAENMGSYSISLAPICTLAGYVSPVVVASAAVAAGFIILQ